MWTKPFTRTGLDLHYFLLLWQVPPDVHTFIQSDGCRLKWNVIFYSVSDYIFPFKWQQSDRIHWRCLWLDINFTQMYPQWTSVHWVDECIQSHIYGCKKGFRAACLRFHYHFDFIAMLPCWWMIREWNASYPVICVLLLHVCIVCVSRSCPRRHSRIEVIC